MQLLDVRDSATGDRDKDCYGNHGKGDNIWFYSYRPVNG